MKALLASASLIAVLSAPAGATDIEFWYGNTGDTETAIQDACAAFNESQSDHSIKCVGQGSYEAGMQKAIAAVRADQHPVLIQFFDAGTLDLMLSGAVEPVQQAMPDTDWDSYIRGARSFYETSTGELYGQPYNASTLLFYGNKKLLDQAGVETLPETYEELVEVAGKLKDAGVDCPYATDGHPWRVLEQFAARHGVPVASHNNGYAGLDAEYLINQGLIAEHLGNLVQWREDGLLRLSEDTKAGKYTDAFNAGECAMIENSTGGFGSQYRALGDDLLVAQAPIYDGHERYNTLVGGASIWLMKGHDEDSVAAAKAFLDFVRLPEQQIAFTRKTGYVPVTTDVLTQMEQEGLTEDPAFGATVPGITALNQPANDDSRGIRLGFYVQFRDIFIEEMQKAFGGKQDVQTALDNAKTRGDQLLRRFEQTYQGVELP